MGGGGLTETTWVSLVLPICTNFDSVDFALSSGEQIPQPARIVRTDLANERQQRFLPIPAEER